MKRFRALVMGTAHVRVARGQTAAAQSDVVIEDAPVMAPVPVSAPKAPAKSTN